MTLFLWHSKQGALGWALGGAVGTGAFFLGACCWYLGIGRINGGGAVEAGIMSVQLCPLIGGASLTYSYMISVGIDPSRSIDYGKVALAYGTGFFLGIFLGSGIAAGSVKATVGNLPLRAATTTANATAGRAISNGALGGAS